MSIVYTVISPLKNTVMTRPNITNFEEREHGIYFIWEGSQCFVNWNVLGTYSLVEEDENDT